jgi:hypothetical protein
MLWSSEPIVIFFRAKVFPIFVSCGFIIVPGVTPWAANT